MNFMDVDKTKLVSYRTSTHTAAAVNVRVSCQGFCANQCLTLSKPCRFQFLKVDGEMSENMRSQLQEHNSLFIKTKAEKC